MSKKDEPTRKQLLDAVADMNEVMGLSPAIGTDDDDNDILDDMADDDLMAEIKAGSSQVDKKDDLDDSTWSVLEALGSSPRSKKAAKKEKKAEPAPPEKAKEKNGGNGNGNEKKKIEKVEKTEKADKPKKPVGNKKDPKYIRGLSILDALRNAGKRGKTVEEIGDLANKIFVKAGGKDNIKQSRHLANLLVDKVLVHAGFAKEISKGKFTAA